MNRRALLSTTALILPALALFGCGQTPAQWAQDAATIGPAVQGLGSALAAVAGIPATTVAAAVSYLNSLEQAAADIATSVATPSASMVTELQGAALSLEPIAQQYLGGSKWLPIVEAIVSLMPEFTALVSIVGAASTPPEMTLDHARAVLRAAG